MDDGKHGTNEVSVWVFYHLLPRSQILTYMKIINYLENVGIKLYKKYVKKYELVYININSFTKIFCRNSYKIGIKMQSVKVWEKHFWI